MRVKTKQPTIDELTRVYNLFQMNKISLKLFLETYQWCRYDPRIGELLVLALKDYWDQWNPLEVSNTIKSHQWPQVLGVLGAHTLLLLPKKDKPFFLNWLGCCFYRVSWKKEWSIFHIGIFKFGGKLLRSEAIDAIPLYLEWGFYSATPMLNMDPNSSLSRKTFVKKNVRLDKLKELFTMKKQIQVKDYIEFLNAKISRRTAELDLSQWAKKKGQTKAAVYRPSKKLSRA